MLNTTFDLLSSLPLISFWSAILSFVPITFYLLLINPPLYKTEQKHLLGIYIIKEEFLLTKMRRTRLRVAAGIYAVCLLFFTAVYVVNQTQYGHKGLGPFNVLSSLSVIFFWMSVVSYLPMAFYLFLKNPWKSKEEGFCLTGIYIGYGFCILLFSIAYAYVWLKEKQLLIGAEDLFGALATVIFCAALISYIPILIYIFLKVADPLKNKKIGPHVIFIIYSICFLFISAVYINKWVLDTKAGIQHMPLRYYLEII